MTWEYQNLTFERPVSKQNSACLEKLHVLLDFSLTVKVATLIFISGCGSAVSSAKEGKSDFIYYLVNSLSFLSCANVCAFHENPNRKHTDLTCINP